MSSAEGGGAARLENPSAEPLEKPPLTARLLLADSLTARRAAGVIAIVTIVVTAAGGVLERLLDRHEYPTIGKGLWFALQTVTTVGYGDATPRQTVGRFIAAVIMLSGIGFLAVVTASVTAALVESSRRRFAARAEKAAEPGLVEINERLAKIEAALAQQASRGPDDGAS